MLSAWAPHTVLKKQPSTLPKYSRYTNPESISEGSGSETLAWIEWQMPKATMILTLRPGAQIKYSNTVPVGAGKAMKKKPRNRLSFSCNNSGFCHNSFILPFCQPSTSRKCCHAPLSQRESAWNWPTNAKKSYYSKKHNLLQYCTQAGKLSSIRRIIPQLINYAHLLNGLHLCCATVSTGK